MIVEVLGFFFHNQMLDTNLNIKCIEYIIK